MTRYIIGIDEAGRGTLAGPVAVGIFMVAENKLKKIDTKGLRDSKKLSAQKREEWKNKIEKMKKDNFANYAVILVSEKYIDKNRIHNSIKYGIEKGIEKLKIKETDKIFLDGGLRLHEKYRYQQTIIKGDEKIPVISLASIVAKVTRDEKMKKISKKYPEFGFDVHKGYGTKMHCKMLKKHGPSPVHRLSFLHN